MFFEEIVKLHQYQKTQIIFHNYVLHTSSSQLFTPADRQKTQTFYGPVTYNHVSATYYYNQNKAVTYFTQRSTLINLQKSK